MGTCHLQVSAVDEDPVCTLEESHRLGTWLGSDSVPPQQPIEADTWLDRLEVDMTRSVAQTSLPGRRMTPLQVPRHGACDRPLLAFVRLLLVRNT